MAMTKPKSSQIEHRGESVQKVIDDLTQQDGVLDTNPSWEDVPKLKGVGANAQAQALANRVEFIKAQSVSFVATLGQLKALPVPSAKSVVYILGYYSEGDCEPWAMQWTPASTRAPNDGEVVLPNGHSGNGRWECGPSVASRAEVWGAANAGVLNITRVNVAISNVSAPTLEFPAGEYFASSTGTINVWRNGFRLFAKNAKATALRHPKISAAISASLINVTGNDCQIDGMTLDGGRPFDETQKSGAMHGRNSLITSYSNKSGLVIRDCVIEDCFRRGIGLQSQNVTIFNCVFNRCGLWQQDLDPFDAAVHFAAGSRNVSVTFSTFNYSGQYAVTALDSEDIYVNNNLIRFTSQIGIGATRCTNVHAEGNRVKYTYNSGIDFQQCNGNYIRNNRLKSCGYGRLNGQNGGDDRIYQAIFCGDDYTLTEANSASRGGEISGNIIRGGWYSGRVESDDSEDGTKWTANWELLGLGDLTGCGIMLVSVRDMAVHHNLLSGIGQYYKAGIQETGKDGVAIKASNYCRGLKVFSNQISNVKLDGVLLGTGNFFMADVTDNNVYGYGRRGVSVQANSKLDAVKLIDNTIGGCMGLFDAATSSDIYVGGLNVSLDRLVISDNILGSPSGESDFAAFRIYFSKNGSTLGIGLIRVHDNLIRNPPSDTSIAFSETPSITAGRWHRNAFQNNVIGRFDQGQIIENIRNIPEMPFDRIGGIPTTGKHCRGSISWYDSPSAGGYIGAVCVETGTPGVWRQFGPINS